MNSWIVSGVGLAKYYRMFTCTVILSFNGIFGNAQVNKQLQVDPGVPEELAQYRASVLKDIHYTLDFIIPASKTEAISASETISFHLLENVQPLQIDFKEERDHLLSLEVNNKASSINFDNEHLVISEEELRTGLNTIEIKFIAGDLSLNRNEDYLYTLLVPDRARTLFPCFDQPDLKARYKLSVTVPKNWEAVANAPLLSRSIKDSKKVLNYDHSDKISTYLFSFVAGKFVKTQKTAAKRKMDFYYRETDEGKLKASLPVIFRLHQQALKFLETYTTILYPFKKFDFIAIPDFQYNGMEHVGAIQYKSSSLFLDSSATKDDQIARAGLIAHETSHMWFGDLVTMRWFNDVWMKEVFANFMADKITQVSIPDMNFDHKFLLDHFPAAYSIDRTTAPNPIRQPLKNLDQAGSLYGNIIYHKAPIMMRQLETLMGKEAFRNGLKEYLHTYYNGNADWPQLIAILDRYTPSDLQSWNKVWVDEPGRPEFSYEMKADNGKISSLTIIQKGEDGSPRIWPQVFQIVLVYPGGKEQFTVRSTTAKTELKQAIRNRVPLYILFNTNGQGYGLFPVDKNMLGKFDGIKDPVMRASAYINLYENMLNGRAITPVELLNIYKDELSHEQEELNLGLLTGQFTDIFWRFISPEKRNEISKQIEEILWQSLKLQSTANKKKIIFRAYQNVAMSTKALDNLYSIWKNQSPPAGLKLTEDDYTPLVFSLAIRNYPGNYLEEQLARIKNPDRQKRFTFLIPSVSVSEETRKKFFESLKDEKKREKEAWVISALQYLHHPLRAETSKLYVKESLELLNEIQSTGDIFFPQNWLRAVLNNYQDKLVAETVREFLSNNPGYNPMLKMKILQAADGVFRAERLIGENKLR